MGYGSARSELIFWCGNENYTSWKKGRFCCKK